MLWSGRSARGEGGERGEGGDVLGCREMQHTRLRVAVGKDLPCRNRELCRSIGGVSAVREGEVLGD